MPLTRYLEVFDERQVEIIWDFLSQPKWEFWQSSTIDSKNFFWCMQLQDNPFFTENLFKSIKNTIGEDFSIERVYANGQTFGLDGDFHIDDSDENAYTFLYYPMKTWSLDWGGETVILEPDGKINSITPFPNSAIMFPSNWWHCGKSPSKNFTDLRITIAYKLKK